MPYPDYLSNTGSYVQTTQVWDVTEINQMEGINSDMRDLLVRLHQQINNIALVLNGKTTGIYLTDQEFVIGDQYYDPASTNQLQLRPVFRRNYYITALPAGVTNIAHGLPLAGSTYNFVKIYGVANDTVNNLYYPLPFAGAAGNNIEVLVNATNIVITNNSGVATFNDVKVTLEFCKE